MTEAASAPTAFEAELAYTPAADVSPDAERPGLLRAKTRAEGPYAAGEALEPHRCTIRDWSEDPDFRPDLLRHGFDCVDLSAREGLLAALKRVRDAGHVLPGDAREIRDRLADAWLRLGDGSRIRLLHIAAEGFIMRRAGPNRMPLGPPASRSKTNDHDAAKAVHADQDVLGTPLRQLLRGAAPWIFRHEAPDSRNAHSPLLLLNLWIPLQQITRPLALMDKQSLARRRQQLRYGLPTGDFLERDESQRVNDIWTFLHDEEHRWYFRAEMPLGAAYVFDTLGTPHGSFIVPGEERAERCHRQLAAGLAALAAGDEAALRRAAGAGAGSGAAAIATRPLRRAIGDMEAMLEEARHGAADLCRGGSTADDWNERARRAMQAVVRQSIEMRVVALRLPRLGSWPRSRSD